MKVVQKENNYGKVAALGTTREFAKFAANLSFDQLPEGVAEKARNCLLDTLGCAFAGFSSKTVNIIVQFAENYRGREESTIWTLGEKVPSFWAASVNACSAHDLELDDGHVLGHTHPGVTVIPPALAIAETLKVSGSDLITAIVLGYEINIRLGEAITPSSLYGRHFHVPGLVGSYSAATAVGKLLNLNEKEMANALGIACLGPVAPFETFDKGVMTKDMYAGWPVVVGTMAALLAHKGFTGADTIFEGKSGFCQAVADEYRLNRITERLGQEWSILTIYQKRHAMCSHGHTTMDAGLEIYEKHHPRPEDIQTVTVRTYGFAAGMNNTEPESDVAAKFSIPYCLAVVLINGRQVGGQDFASSLLKSDKIRQLSRKIKVSLDTEVDRFHKEHEESRRSIVEVVMRNGAKYSSRVDTAKGWPSKPLSYEEIEAKFKTLASGSVSKKEAEEIIKTVNSLESQKSLAGLIQLLS